MAPAPDKICSSPRLLRSLVILSLVLSGGIIAALLLLPKDLWQMTLISASGGLLLILVALLLISYRLSARLNMRIALELDEKKFRTLFTATPYPQMVLMHDRIHLCNNALVQAFGYDDSAKLIGKRFLELSPDTQPDDRPSEASYLEILETLNTEESVQLEWTFCDSHDNPLIMELSLSRTKIGSDDVMLAILKDLSDIKTAENKLKKYAEEVEWQNWQLEKAREDAENANRLKGEFLANMSHELRTPMNGILGMVEMLQKTRMDKRQEDFLRIVRVSSETLLELINDILDYSKIESGKLSLEQVPFNLKEVIYEVIQVMAPRISEKDLELVVDYEPGVPVHYTGDPVRIRQILYNLIGNAIKFTQEGHITVEVQLEEKKNGMATLNFGVKDTGIGIPEDKLDYIFNKFSQADSSTTRKFGGTGLGLAISKHLTEIMGGAIGVDSMIGNGSTFWFNLQLEIDVHQESQAQDYSGLKGKHILIVDDNAIAGAVLQKLAANIGVRSTVIHEPQKALDIMQAALEQNDPYDIIIMDYLMPKMNGLELATAIRDNPAFVDTHLLLTSGMMDEELFDAMKTHGFSGFISKPIIEQHFYDTLMDVHRGVCPLPEVEKFGFFSENSLGASRILLVEDNEVNQMVATHMLEDLGIDVTTANNGVECLKQLESRAFDLILMDCQMPEMDGFEATRKIRELEQNGQLPPTPIIAVTANAMKGDREKCLKAGMDDYISKPIEHQELEAMLARYLKENSERKELPTHSNTPHITGLIDSSTLEQFKIKMGESFDPIMAKYIQGSQELVNSIGEALEGQDLKTAQRHAHSLKSSSAQIGATKLSQFCNKLENDKNASLEQAKSYYAMINEMFHQTESYLSNLSNTG